MGEKDLEINIEEEDPHQSLVSFITKNELDKARTRNSATCIYQVPHRLRRGNETAYTPKVVSIGPIHHGKSLNFIQDHKRLFLKNFLQRTKKGLVHYVKIVKDNENKLRDCYQETFHCSSDEFCYIILVDAIFIVELFLSHYPEKTIEVHLQPPDASERLSYAVHVLREIWPELLFLENQLPFFILEEIWKDATTKSIVEFFHWYYCSQLSLDLEAKEGTNLDLQPLHFVDLVRKLYIQHIKPKSRTQQLETLQVPNATELDQAGVEFRMGSSKNLIDISFCNGVLEIPKLKITDSTESRMRNLAAFEQCCYSHEDSYICHYLILLDYLVNTRHDVDLLVKKQILENWMGDSKDVSDMINELCVGVNIDTRDFYYGDIFYKLDKHYNIPWNHWKANLKQNYFNTPWAAIAFVAAFIGLILTLIQALPTIIDWFKK